jgi:hypothetical protein
MAREAGLSTNGTVSQMVFDFLLQRLGMLSLEPFVRTRSLAARARCVSAHRQFQRLVTIRTKFHTGSFCQLRKLTKNE